MTASLPSPTAGSATPTAQLTLGLDLTGLGAKAPLHTRARTASSQHVSLGDVSDYLLLAVDAGVELVTVGESFRLDDAPRSDAWLDPAVLISRLAAADLLHGTTRIVAALPAGLLDPVRLARAVAGLQVRSEGRAGWQVPAPASAGGVHSEVRRVWNGDRGLSEAGTGAPLLVTSPEPEAAVVAGRYSDVVRLRATTPAEARAQREAIRTAAEAAGRNPDDVRVVVDVLAVIAQDELSAQFRADLLRDVAEAPAASRPTLTLAGTAQSVADVLEEWADVVDGFVLVPGSLPTDVVAIATALVPELAARGLVPAPAVTAVETDDVDDLVTLTF